MMQPSHQDPALRTARAITADYYHVAPTTERNRILQHGLQPTNPYGNEDWGGPESWERVYGPDYRPPEGVYAWPTSGQAYDYAEKLEKGREIPHDVWRIPADNNWDWSVDPDMDYEDARSPRYWEHGPIMDAELHEGPEHRVWDYDMKGPYEQMWNGGKPLGLNADQNPDYAKLWEQRVAE